MARREGKEGAHYFLTLVEENEVCAQCLLRSTLKKSMMVKTGIKFMSVVILHRDDCYRKRTIDVQYCRYDYALICRWFLCQGSGSGLEGLLPSTPGFVLVLNPPLQDQ